ncbi:MAG: hypothetical protein ABMA26_23775, partial [Limisphaerales bacterium]
LQHPRLVQRTQQVHAKNLPPTSGHCLLRIESIVTTGIGILLAIPPSVPVFGLALLPLVYFLSRIPAARIVQVSGWRWASRLRPNHVASGMVGLVVVSTVLFVMSMHQLETRHFLAYWILKFGYIVSGLAMGIGLTSVWEERVVAALARKEHPDANFFTSVVRANYLTFGAVMLVAAVATLPKRMQSPDFLVFLRDTLERVWNSFA